MHVLLMNAGNLQAIPASKFSVPRSPYDTEGGIVFFPRMVEKIRLFERGVLPEIYMPTLSKFFDQRCCSLLGVNYEDLAQVVRSGLSDEQALKWAFKNGNRPTSDQIEIWNSFMMKRGWRDEATCHLKRRLKDLGCEDHTEIQTIFDCIEFEEGRAIRKSLDSLVR